MAKFNFNLRKQNVNSAPIYMVVRWERKKLVYPTEESANPKKWQNDKKKPNFQRVIQTKKDKTATELNARLDKMESESREIFRRFFNDNNRYPSVDELKDKLNEKNNRTPLLEKLDFFGFFDKYILEAKTKTNQQTSRAISPNTIKLYKNAQNHLKDFASKRKKRIDFDTIDLDFYHEFSTYLTKTKSFAPNTIGRVIKITKGVLNDATERGLNKNLTFKSRRFKVITEKVENIYLTEAELDALFQLDLSAEKRLERARDIFLMGCYTGLRFSDFSKLDSKRITGDVIEIETQKTAEKVIIPLHPRVVALFEKYGDKIPHEISNQKLNEYIKEVGKKLAAEEQKVLDNDVSVKETRGGKTTFKDFKKYELISSHTARRSFATNAYLAGIPPFVIMGVTGHKTEKAFFEYIKITSQDKARIFQMYTKNLAGGKV